MFELSSRVHHPAGFNKHGYEYEYDDGTAFDHVATAAGKADRSAARGVDLHLLAG